MDIEAYLEGSMAASEREVFEKRLSGDAALRKELEQYQSLRSDLDWHFAAKDVAAAAVLRAQLEAKRRRWSRLLLFTLLVLLVGIVAFWLFFPKGPTQGSQLDIPVLEDNQVPKSQSPLTPEPSAPQQTMPKEGSQKTPSPIAKDLRPIKNRPDDLLRDLPQEEVSEQFLPLFERLMKGFSPPVPESGQWSSTVRSIRKNKPESALKELKTQKTNPFQKDTAAYLTAVSELMLKRPSAAESYLYPLLENEKWKNEARYLLVWAYLLRGEDETAASALKALPDGFREKSAILEALK